MNTEIFQVISRKQFRKKNMLGTFGEELLISRKINNEVFFLIESIKLSKLQ